ncbi:MAG: methyltransferase, partial [Bacillota bacterium]|nr:methyltransferase [Bacillota bacterium]
MNGLQAIKAFKGGSFSVLKQEKWLLYIGMTKETKINLERLTSLKEAGNNYVLDYVERTLEVLEEIPVSTDNKSLVEEVLKWSETAKGGLPHKRTDWEAREYNLFAHNIGSAQIYLEHTPAADSVKREIIYTLIKTHGLIGQFLRGEVTLQENRELTLLLEKKLLSREDFKEIVLALNFCIIKAVSSELWQEVGEKVETVVGSLAEGDFSMEYSLKDRLKALRENSIKNGEDFNSAYDEVFIDENLYNTVERFLQKVQLWYVEAALYDFSFEEFIKIFLMTAREIDLEKTRHISFEEFMKEIYYEHEGKKRVNIYKKRIIEKYLSQYSIEGILEGKHIENIHVRHKIIFKDTFQETAFFTFSFSPAGEKLIDFCTEAEKSGLLYEKAIVLLFDLFELRKDKYDRFYEEEAYLSTMNGSIDNKKIILNYISGNTVIDIGPGGGALMDMMEEMLPGKRIIGVDISQNVIDSLSRKKNLENHSWEVMYGDALNLSQYMEEGSVDTIIFCSILHELFSYIE